ncbi:hypothetical protein CR513_62249, partial [Mucuna pruriens]
MDNEQVQFHLGILDFDLAFMEEKSTAITDSNNNEEKIYYKSWQRTNKLNLMFMRITVVDSIKTTLSKTKSVKKFISMRIVEFENARFIENGKISGSIIPRDVEIKE